MGVRERAFVWVGEGSLQTDRPITSPPPDLGSSGGKSLGSLHLQLCENSADVAPTFSPTGRRVFAHRHAFSGLELQGAQPVKRACLPPETRRTSFPQTRMRTRELPEGSGSRCPVCPSAWTHSSLTAGRRRRRTQEEVPTMQLLMMMFPSS